MKRYLLTAFMFLAPTLGLFAEEAAEGHGAEGWTSPIWHVPMIAWQSVNLIIVVVLFWYLLRRPAPAFFASRAEEIENLLRKAVREREEARERLREIEEKMAHLDDEVTAIEQSAVEAAERDKVKILEETEAARARIQKEAREDLDRRLKEARRDLRVYAADLAVDMAREILASNIKAEDEERFRADFLNKMKEEGR